MQFGAGSKARAKERARARVKAKAKARITAKQESRTQVRVRVRGTRSGQVVASQKEQVKPKEVKDLGRRVKERVEDPASSVAKMVTLPANAGRVAEKVVIEDSLRR